MSLYFPKIKGGLVPQARSGHTAVFYNGKIIIYGGYNENTSPQVTGHLNSSYMPPNEIWCYDIEVCQWTRLGTTGDHPSTGLSGAVCCVLGDFMIIFGGYGDGFGRLNLVFELNLKTLEWRNLTKHGLINGVYPSKRDKFSCWVHKNKVIYFGGFGLPPNKENNKNGEFCYDEHPLGDFTGIGWSSDICVLDFSNSDVISWNYPSIKDSGPTPRAAHAAAKIGDKGYVFGGRHKDKRVNDMYYLHLDTYKWSKVAYNTTAPCGRSWHVLQRLSENQLFLYAGLDNEGNSLSDMWLFNTDICSWSEIRNVEERIGPITSRLWHTGTITQNEGQVIIFGGCRNSVLSADPSCHCNTTLVYQTNPSSLELLCIKKIIECLPLLKNTHFKLPNHIEKRLYSHAHALGLHVHGDGSMHHHGTCHII